MNDVERLGMKERDASEPAKPGSQQRDGSEAATKISLPKRCIRLVLQLEDTPQNRHTIMLAQGYILAISRPIDGDVAILKREEITILEHGRPTPPPNDQAMRPETSKCQ